MGTKKLNLGCGHDIREGWVNVDVVQLPRVDVVHDIEQIPLPFEDSEFDVVLCQDIFEHIDYIPVLREVHRIVKTGGRVVIRVPHFTSRRNYDDPTHKKMFSIRTFEFFIRDSRARRGYYFDFHFSRIASSKIVFEKKLYLYNYGVEWLVNASRKLKETVYEATFLSRLFPADSIIITLIK